MCTYIRTHVYIVHTYTHMHSLEVQQSMHSSSCGPLLMQETNQLGNKLHSWQDRLQVATTLEKSCRCTTKVHKSPRSSMCSFLNLPHLRQHSGMRPHSTTLCWLMSELQPQQCNLTLEEVEVVGCTSHPCGRQSWSCTIRSVAGGLAC